MSALTLLHRSPAYIEHSGSSTGAGSHLKQARLKLADPAPCCNTAGACCQLHGWGAGRDVWPGHLTIQHRCLQVPHKGKQLLTLCAGLQFLCRLPRARSSPAMQGQQEEPQLPRAGGGGNAELNTSLASRRADQGSAVDQAGIGACHQECLLHMCWAASVFGGPNREVAGSAFLQAPGCSSHGMWWCQRQHVARLLGRCLKKTCNLQHKGWAWCTCPAIYDRSCH